MTLEEVKEAIRAKTPVRMRHLFGEEIEYKCVLCILPPHGEEKEHMIVLEDKSGRSVTYCKLAQLIDSEKQPTAAQV